MNLGERVRAVSGRLNELEPIDDPDNVEGMSRNEVMDHLKSNRERLEQRLKILGKAFPNVFEDARQMVLLGRKAMETHPTVMGPVLRQIMEISDPYFLGEKRELQTIFVAALGDLRALEGISF